MSSRLLAFIIAQFVVLVSAAHLHDPGTLWSGSVFYGVLSAQFALVGIWAGVGDRPNLRRVVTALLFTIGLCAVAVTRANFNAWDLLLAMVRLLALGMVFGLMRHQRELVVRRTNENTEIRLLQLTLKHLLVLVFVSAIFLAVMRFLDNYDGIYYESLLIIMIILVGIGGSLVSLVAATVALSKYDVTKVGVSVFVILLLAGIMAWFAYAQTDSYNTAVQWFLLAIIEVFVVAVSLLAIRMGGYHLVSNDVLATA